MKNVEKDSGGKNENVFLLLADISHLRKKSNNWLAANASCLTEIKSHLHGDLLSLLYLDKAGIGDIATTRGMCVLGEHVRTPAPVNTVLI